MLRLFGLAVLITQCLAIWETHHLVHLSKDGKTISQDIIHDVEENTVLVIIGDVSEYENTFPTVNFHDFDTGYVVFKDIKHQMCSLTRAPIPAATPEIYRMGLSNITLEYTAAYDPTPLTYTSVTEIAGSRIADFCKNYVTYTSILTRQERKKRGVRRQFTGISKYTYSECKNDLDTLKPCDSWCVNCLIQVDAQEYQSLSQSTVG